MKTIIFLILIALTIECSSQIIQEQSYVQQVWKTEFGGDNLDAMAIDNAGNVYVTGRRVEANYDWGTIKYNSAGERVWYTDFSGNHADIPHAIAVDNLGNVYVTGESDYLSSDFYTVKYNSAGVEQWSKSYGNTGNDIAWSIALDENRNVYVTGSDMKDGQTDCVTLKYTPGGTLVWEARYESPNNGTDRGTSIAVDIYGSIYVAGFTENPNTGNDYLVVKYNSSGVQQWVRTYDGTAHGSDVVRKMVVSSNAVYITGYSDGEGTDKDYLTLKYNLTGGLYYAKRYNGPANGEDRGASLVVDNAGNAYVTGYSKSTYMGFDYATVKYNSMGALQWLKREDGGNNYDDQARDIAIDDDGDVYVTGVFKKTEDDYQLATVKYSSSGIQKWLKKLSSPGKVSEGSFIIVDASENIYVGGNSDLLGSNTGTYNCFLVVKYTQSPYAIQNRIEMPNTFSLSQNYPNPFNPITKISFSIPSSSYTKLIVYDISGKQVAELVDNTLDAGTYNIDFDASQLASGTYFYRITAGDFTEVKKMILVK